MQLNFKLFQTFELFVPEKTHEEDWGDERPGVNAGGRLGGVVNDRNQSAVDVLER